MRVITNLARDQRVFTSNVFLVTGEQRVLVDVGNEFDVVGAVREHVDTVDAVVLTHTHRDHVANLPPVTEAFDAPVYAYDGEFEGVDRTLADGDHVQLGDHEYEALHTPGHKNDHLCLYSQAGRTLFAGDLVFANGSFGRTDLEEGDRPTLVESIRRLHDTVDDDLAAMHSGHGPSVETTPKQDIELALQAAQF
jgi:glyoxylase-like metal-dependent hydrolase (beta-lactamase superfamily II)